MPYFLETWKNTFLEYSSHFDSGIWSTVFHYKKESQQDKESHTFPQNPFSLSFLWQLYEL